jgi:hypothetical protein
VVGKFIAESMLAELLEAVAMLSGYLTDEMVLAFPKGLL